MRNEPSGKLAIVLLRGLGWGFVGGATGGALILAAAAVVTADPDELVWCVFAALIGGIFGTVLGLVCAAILLVPDERWSLAHPGLIRLFTGTSALMPVLLFLQRSLTVGWTMLWLLLTLGALFFMLGATLAHRVLWGVWRLRPSKPAAEDVRHGLTA